MQLSADVTGKCCTLPNQKQTIVTKIIDELLTISMHTHTVRVIEPSFITFEQYQDKRG